MLQTRCARGMLVVGRRKVGFRSSRRRGEMDIGRVLVRDGSASGMLLINGCGTGLLCDGRRREIDIGGRSLRDGRQGCRDRRVLVVHGVCRGALRRRGRHRGLQLSGLLGWLLWEEAKTSARKRSRGRVLAWVVVGWGCWVDKAPLADGGRRGRIVGVGTGLRACGLLVGVGHDVKIRGLLVVVEASEL